MDFLEKTMKFIVEKCRNPFLYLENDRNISDSLLSFKINYWDFRGENKLGLIWAKLTSSWDLTLL